MSLCIWSFYEFKALFEVKGGGAGFKSEGSIFGELWNPDSIFLTSKVFWNLYIIFLAFWNAKACLIWTLYANLALNLNLITFSKRLSRFERLYKVYTDLYMFLLYSYMVCESMGMTYLYVLVYGMYT